MIMILLSRLTGKKRSNWRQRIVKKVNVSKSSYYKRRRANARYLHAYTGSKGCEKLRKDSQPHYSKSATDITPKTQVPSYQIRNCCMPYNRSIVSFPRLVLAPVFEFNCIGTIGSSVTRINIGWHSEIEKMEEQPSSVKERLNSSAGPWNRKAGNPSRYLMKSSCYCKTKKSWWTPMKPNLLDRLYYPPRPPCQNPPPESRSQDTKEHCQH